MNFEQTFQELPTVGWLSEVEARTLWQAARETAGDILEIGTYCGRSAHLLARALEDKPSQQLICCDPFEAGFDGVNTPTESEIVRSVVDTLWSLPNAWRISVCRMREAQLRSSWAGTRRLGLVYIDGDHSAEATGAAIDHWIGLTSAIAFHDYGGSHPGVAQSIRERRTKYSLLNRRPIVGGRVALFR